MPKLIVIEQGKKTVYNLTREITTLGRAPDSHILLRDPRSSRYHAAIHQIGDTFEIRDLGSQNGTVVNGSFIEKKQLRSGDLLEIGEVRIFLEKIDEKKLRDSAAPHPAGRTMTSLAVPEDPGDPEGEEEDEGVVQERMNLLQLQRERKNLLRLQRVTMALSSTLELEKLLGIIVDHAIELAEAERGFLILADGSDIHFEVARNFAKEEVAEPEFNVSRTIAEKVLATGEPVLAVNAMDDTRFKAIHSISAIGLRSVLCLPFRSRGAVVGVLYIDNRLQKGVFSREHLRMLEALGAQAAAAIDHARMFSDLEKNQTELLEANRRIERLNKVLKERVEKQQIELSRIQTELVSKQSELEHRYDYSQIVGRSEAMNDLFKRLDRVIPTEMSVLVEGESGTGKELVARAIHYMGPRRKRKFVTENCAALTESLLESELFGYKRGAFTGANRDKKGLFEEASGGTLFLDEVGEMSPAMQKKLLRVLQEHEIRPVGAKSTVPVDVRIVCASNRDLRTLVDEGIFREDLLYRLRVLTVDLPPLRDRKEDIPLLVSHFFDRIEGEGQRIPSRIDPAVLEVLMTYHWPGNVRELENEVRRLIALSDEAVTVDSISRSIRYEDGGAFPPPSEGELRPLEEQVRDLEVREIRRALDATDGNKTKAAESLGISRFTLQRKLDKYGLDLGDR